MNEIKCPNCGTVFQIDEKDYTNILKQIRDKEFEKELLLREAEFKKDKENSIMLIESKAKNKLIEEVSKKDLEINELKLNIKNIKENTKSKIENEYLEKLQEKELKLKELESKIKLIESNNKLEIKDAIILKEKEIDTLNNKIEINKNEFLLKEKNLKESYEEKIKNKDEQIAYYKDFKARQSTKMIGESLELHCNNEFNKLRPLFKNAYFEKDNEVSKATGSKGDFIFRDFDDDNTEIVSIMFEMKNEADETATKHKNEDFLKELDKDRKEKKCEYAVLVSLLEIDVCN